MVRSIRFVPQLGRNQNCHRPGTQSVMPESVVNPLPRQITTATPITPVSEPIIDPSEHIANLVRAAVSKPTVLPISYVIQENIGDRISRLAAPKAKAVTPVITPPKIPQPDPNWIPTTTVAVQLFELDWRDLLKKEEAVPSVVSSTPPVSAEQPATVIVATPPIPAAEAETPPRQEAPQKILQEPDEIATVKPAAEKKKAKERLGAETSKLETVSKVASPSERSPEAKPVAEVPSTPVQQAPAVETVSAPPESKIPDPKVVEVPVEPNPTLSEKASTEIACPACHSTELRKNGHRNDKQRYICKDCGKQFAAPEPLTSTPEPSKSKQNSRPQNSAVKEPQSLPSAADSPSKASVAQSKNKKKPKGFGTKKGKK